MQINSNWKTIFKIMGIVTAFYIAVFLIWNITSPNNKPSGLLWDLRKEGFKENPLEDRYINQNKD